MRGNRVKEWLFCYKTYIFAGMLIGLFVYLPMMALDLVNDLDGIWHPSNFIAGDWEISLGRGLQRYADRARFGLVTSSFNSMLVVFLISLADVLVIDRLERQNTFFSYLLLMISIASPVVCESLSYSYMSVNFGLAYFFSVMAFYLLTWNFTEKPGLRGLAAGGAFAVTMAFYQAYINVTCVLVLFYLLKELLRQVEWKKLRADFVNALIMIVSGGVGYVILTKLLLWRAGIELAGYRGAANISVGLILKSMPETFLETYRQYGNYVFTGRLHANLEFSFLFILLLSAFFGGVVLCRGWALWKANKGYAMSYLIGVLLIPVAACFVCMIAVGNSITGLMAMGIVMSVLLSFEMGLELPVLKKFLPVVLLVMAWYYVSTVENDQIALKEGKNATIHLAQNVVSELITKESLEMADCVALVGRAAENPMFARSSAYEMANDYAQFGRWSTDARNHRVTWDGVLRNFCGTNLNLCGEERYKELTALEEVKNMPCFPQNGSVKQIEDVIVVKISEVY